MRRIMPFFVLVLIMFLMGKFLIMFSTLETSNVTPKELTQEEKEIIVWQAGENTRRALTHRMMFN